MDELNFLQCRYFAELFALKYLFCINYIFSKFAELRYIIARTYNKDRRFKLSLLLNLFPPCYNVNNPRLSQAKFV